MICRYFLPKNKKLRRWGFIKNLQAQEQHLPKYREALWEAFQQIINHNLFTHDLVVNIYRQIKEAEDGFRIKDVRIGNENRTVYTPPEHGKILSDKIDNWFEFVNSKNELDPLISMAIIHYQFESVHPFFDGNGRTGRIINVLYLV